jgi:hypothetical protein
MITTESAKMSLSEAKLRSIINMVADVRSAHAAMAAAELHMLVADLIDSIAGPIPSANGSSAESSAPTPDALIDVAVGRPSNMRLTDFAPKSATRPSGRGW